MESQVVTESPELDAAIVNPANWGNEDWVHAQFAWLRDNAPIRHLSPDGFDPFWSIARHADIRYIESDKTLFINDPRPLLSPKLLNAVVMQLTGRRHLV
ncbi:MAG: hypothetical protein OXH52_09285, partial [Gammaproteobacteria bacterium]|nr:hypothetical protein [Gammaproteobacteria bacterium]